jgi:2,3-bisphosphoglycerate-independent phosphoglycerate mutase
MDREDLYKKISTTNDEKMVLVVLDGLGGLPQAGRTELETAATPNLDLLAAESELGLTHPIGIGITPGSGPAHLGLFGYDPLRHEIGRGILEALGVGITVGKRDVTVRGNFASHENRIITDRRAGRIPSEKNREIIDYLKTRIKKIEDVDIALYSGEEHRFVLVMTGDGLSDQISDADPEVTGQPFKYSQAKTPEAEKTARIVNAFIDRLTEELKDFHPANTCLLRGFAKYPAIPSMHDLFQLKTAAVAVYPMYKGLAQLVGMEILATGKTVADEIATIQEHWADFDFFFLHVKKTDSYGEDGKFADKVHVIEEFDQQLPALLELRPDVLVVTGDHSTPALMKSHSWHPNPFLIKARYQRVSKTGAGGLKFGESACAGGVLGRFHSVDILPLMMANAGKFKKYGA